MSLERHEWEGLVREVLAGRHAGPPRRPRILFFVYDGIGLGHVRRLARIAAEIQGEASCLFVCGHRAAAWLVPENCEYMHIPSWESLIGERASYWGRRAFVDMSSAQARVFRRRLLWAIVAAFAPTAIVVDYMPTGKRGEFLHVIREHRAKKLFVMRGVMDPMDVVQRQLVDPETRMVLEANYSGILVTCDSRICDVAREYGLGELISSKTTYCGYVSEALDPVAVEACRRQRGIPAGKKWVVCSAGGGVLGERLIQACLNLGDKVSGAYFDIVAGPRSACRVASDQGSGPGERVRVHQECRELPLLHGAADIVISAGGYNSIVESLEGTAHLICAPSQLRQDDEQYIHVQKLQRLIPIDLVLELGSLEAALRRRLDSTALPRPPGRRLLNFDGARNCGRLILAAALEP